MGHRYSIDKDNMKAAGDSVAVQDDVNDNDAANTDKLGNVDNFVKTCVVTRGQSVHQMGPAMHGTRVFQFASWFIAY